MHAIGNKSQFRYDHEGLHYNLKRLFYFEKTRIEEKSGQTLLIGKDGA